MTTKPLSLVIFTPYGKEINLCLTCKKSCNCKIDFEKLVDDAQEDLFNGIHDFLKGYHQTAEGMHAERVREHEERFTRKISKVLEDIPLEKGSGRRFYKKMAYVIPEEHRPPLGVEPIQGIEFVVMMFSIPQELWKPHFPGLLTEEGFEFEIEE